MRQYAFFATCPKGLEELLAAEVLSLGGGDVRQTVAGVSFAGELAAAQRICLWSRLANRVLLTLARIPAADAQALYEGVQTVRWMDHLRPEGTLAVDFSGSNEAIVHTRFGSQKVKDAIVDQIRDKAGRRPSVDLTDPDLRVNVHLHAEEAVVCVDLSGESLHRRCFREQGGEAPLKENLAAALLLRAGWSETAAAGGPFLDPCCGSGTFLLEAALLAADVAPGLLRPGFGFERWPGCDRPAWSQLRQEAEDRRRAGLARKLPGIWGSDGDPHAVVRSRRSADKAGFGRWIRVSVRELADLCPPPGVGLMLTNPPYGERIGETSALALLYRHLGSRLKLHFAGWKAGVFTGNPDLGKTMGLRARKVYSLFNGAIPCKLLLFQVEKEWFVEKPPEAVPETAGRLPVPSAEAKAGEGWSEGAAMLANRLKKNLRLVGKWARRADITCYRLYDADMKEYAFALDLYGGYAVFQEYEAPSDVDPVRAQTRRNDALKVIPDVLGIPPDHLVQKRRERHREGFQHGRLDDRGSYLEVQEGEARLLVNLTDTIDTGLFLDHRPLRRMIRDEVHGKRFLNLFCYTGAATVQAAVGGARNTTSVDLSRTYLEWARRNLALNGLSESLHRLVRADCSVWLEEGDDVFDIILLDAPTISRSKNARNSLDIQRDHPGLIRKAVRRLAPTGTLYFSCNFRRFRMQAELLADLDVVDITASTVDRDFARNPRIHQCWKIRRQPRS